MLEPDALKGARPVLRGPGPRDGLRLPDRPETELESNAGSGVVLFLEAFVIGIRAS